MLTINVKQAVVRQSLEIYKDNDLSLAFTLEDEADPSAYTVAFKVKDNPTDAAEDVNIAGSWDTNRFLFTIADTATNALTARKYYYEICRTDAGSERTYAIGPLRLLQTVRNTA